MSVLLIFVTVTVVFLASHECDSYSDQFSGFRKIRSVVPIPPWNLTYLDKLRNDLLTNYDKYARSGQHYDITTVQIGLSIVYLETDELNSTMSVSSWLNLLNLGFFKQLWTDSKLKWDKNDYGGIESIKMADHEIWQPDIYLYNSAASGGEAIARYGNPNAIVYSNGQVMWVPPLKFTALCEFNLKYWPFDTQYCYLKFGSWTRSAKEIKLELLGDDHIELEPSIVYSAWDLNYTAEIGSSLRNCCPDTFYHAHFNLTLTRKSSFYMAVVTTPAIVIVGLILMQCWLPSQGGERIVLSCFTIIMISMLLIYFTQKVSGMGIGVPWIVLFYTTSLYISCFSLIESIFVLLLLKPKEKETLPWNIKKHLKGKFGKFLLLEHYASECYCVNNQPAEEMKNYHESEFEDRIEESDVVIKSTPESRIQQEWEILILAIDRVFFIIYSFVYLVLFFAYLI